MKKNTPSVKSLRKIEAQTAIKFRNKISLGEVYYSYSQWPTKEIDGVEFLPVVKQPPSQSLTQTILYMRKDSLERVR